MAKQIDEIWCFTAMDASGEGVPAVTIGGVAYPLFGADLERVKSLAQIAKGVQEQSGKRLRLFKFSKKTEILNWESMGE
jgi:hypothetical protein